MENHQWIDHPLLKYPIVNTVLKHLGPKDLKQCRLVCKAWNVFTIPFTRKAFTITLLENHPTRGPQHALENFVQAFRSNQQGIPCAKYIFGSFCTTDGVGAEFLELCGETIKDIKFYDDVYKVEDVSELLKSSPNVECFQIPPKLYSSSGNIVELFSHCSEESKPRLMCLNKIYVFHENSEERKKFCPTFLEELMTVAPNISSFVMYEIYTQRSIHPEYDEKLISTVVMEVLSLIEMLGRESSIIDVKIKTQNSGRYSESFDLLRKMISKPNGMRLKSLAYHKMYSRHATFEFDVVSPLKETLENLSMNCRTFKEFPKMINMRSLSLNLPNEFNSNFINLKELYPVLEELEIWQDTPKPLQFHQPRHEYLNFFPESEPCPTMKSLKLGYVSMRINVFNQIQTVLPNLTGLEIDNDVDGVEILRQIMSQMTQLEFLKIHVDFNLKSTDSIDSILTGISTHALGRIRRALNNLNIKETKVERREKIMKLIWNKCTEFPSIVNLTNLRHLSICVTGNEGKRNRGSHVTNLTGYLGFHSMPCLKNLLIRKCKMTKTCCEILKEDLGLETWTFESPDCWNDIIPSG